MIAASMQQLSAELSLQPDHSDLSLGELSLSDELSAQSDLAMRKIGQGELILDGDLNSKDLEVSYGTLIIDEPSYDPIRDPGNWVILSDESPLLVTDFLPTIPPTELRPFESSNTTTVIPEHSTVGLFIGLLSMIYIYLNRRSLKR